MPLTTPATNGSAMLVTTTPMVSLRRVTRLRAAALVRYPASWAMRWIFSTVSGFTNGLLRSARETVECATPAILAISLMEAGFVKVVEFGLRAFTREPGSRGLQLRQSAMLERTNGTR